MDHEKFSALIHRLYGVVSDLQEMFPGRHFTPDGHMVGSIGECLVADAFDLELMPASNKGFDAQDSTGKRVEIKATQSSSVAFRSCPDYTIVIQIERDGSFETSVIGSLYKIAPTNFDIMHLSHTPVTKLLLQLYLLIATFITLSLWCIL